MIYHEVLTKELLEPTIQEITPFHTQGWRKMLETCMNYNATAVLSSRKNEPLLLTFFFTTKKGIFHFAGSPIPGSMTPFLDPVWLKELNTSEKNEIFREQYHFIQKQKTKYAYIEYRFQNYNDAKALVQNTNLILSKPQTYYLELNSGSESAWKNIKSRTRTKINKARKKGVVVEEITDLSEALELVPYFYQLLKEVFQKSNQKPGQTELCYEQLIQKMLPKNLLFIKCSINDDIATMGIFPYDKKMIYYLSGVSNQLGYRNEANALMHWHVIDFALQKGIGLYDMGGKGIASIDRFKESFGARVHDYGKLNFKTKTASAAEWIYRKIKNIK
jgi:lipid II:glycine glycyltransferase (peptidoglycan interpeptide bridge formation enzyme)